MDDRGRAGLPARTTRDRLTTLDDADRLLFLSLATDAILIALHVLHLTIDAFGDRSYSIAVERGLGETFQYVKAGWMVLLLGAVAITRRDRGYGAWSVVVFIILLDDVYILRERAGSTIGELTGLGSVLGLRVQDIGELVVAGVLGIVVVALVVVAFHASRASRQLSRSMIPWLVLLAAFGIGVDMVHATTPTDSVIREVVGTIEDGGEMIVLSFMLRLAFAAHRPAGASAGRPSSAG